MSDCSCKKFEKSSEQKIVPASTDSHQDPEKDRDENSVSYIKNPFINEEEDVLFHLALSNKTDDLKSMFHDVKFVCLGGTVDRMKEFAEYLKNELQLPDDGDELQDLTGKGHRYSTFRVGCSAYKVGCVLCVNHGMGFPSIMILLHELIKLMHYAQARDPVFIRMGTSGGFKVSAGTVVISTQVLNDYLEPCFRVPILGKTYKWPCVLDTEIARNMKSIGDERGDIPILLGTTMSQEHFYEGTAMKTGAICENSDEDRNEYFDQLRKSQVLSADMEALALGAITHKVGIKAAVLSVVVNDAFAAKRVAATPEEAKEWQRRPGIIIAEYIKRFYKT